MYAPLRGDMQVMMYSSIAALALCAAASHSSAQQVIQHGDTSSWGPPSGAWPHPGKGGPHPSYPGQWGPNWNYSGFPEDQTYRTNAIVEMFRFAWDGYYKYAYPHDDLLPANNSFSDSRNGWGLTMIDGLDTAIIMEQQDIVDIILDWIPKVDFTKNNSPHPVSTSLFETNIRYIGGMLSAYDLLKGPFTHMVHSSNAASVDALLTQTVRLADALKFAFDTPTGIPINDLFLDNRTFTNDSRLADGTYTAGLAAFGTLVLEWQHLSDLTGDPSYGALAQRAESYWFHGTEVFPGLTGGNFSVVNGSILDDYGGFTSGNDSAYEYLIKMYVYDPERYANYSARFTAAADSAIEYLLSHPSSRPDLTMVGAFHGRDMEYYSEQLACFIGGAFILGSTALPDRPNYLQYGLDFAEFCANGYRSTASGIGPILYSWNTTVLSDPANNFTNQTSLYDRAGFFIPDNNAYFNGQAPEAVESWYYAWQVTRDPYWRDVAWAYTLAQNRTERVGSGWSSVNDVLVANGNGTQNFMASFMLAEVLKYQYLIQTDGKAVYNVEVPEEGGGNVNYFVWNTEAHPFKVAAKKPV